MSGNDAFDRAVRALRETAETSAADVARTRMRVLETLHRGERRGRRTLWVLIPIAAVLAGGAALAKDSDVMHRVWTGVAETVGIVTPAEKPAPVRPARGPDVSPPDPVAEPPAIAPSETENIEPKSAAPSFAKAQESAAPADTLPAAPRRQRRTDVADRASAPLSPPSSEAVEPEVPAASAPDDGEAASLKLYKNAYRLHFVEQRYAEALAAWDEYVRSASKGRLVVEARYNRAIALVRLGRRAEAEAALAPFARGEVSGGYRAREARELLDALNASSR
jgi:hypothetical protein